MKLNQLIETKYVGQDEKPQFTNFSAEKVVQTFFDKQPDAWVDDPNQEAHAPKNGLYIKDDEDIQVEWLNLRNGEWYSLVGSEGEYHVNPAKFKIDMKRAVYRP